MTHVETTPHELRANILFDGHDDRPYCAFRKLMSTLDGDFQHEVEIGNETWHVSLGFDVSGVAPQPDDSVAKLYEYTLSAQGDGHRSISARFQPRFETMTKYICRIHIGHECIPACYKTPALHFARTLSTCLFATRPSVTDLERVVSTTDGAVSRRNR